MTKHEQCKYYFKKEVDRSKEIYSGLTDGLMKIEVTEMKDACGLNPVSIVIEKDQPLCQYYKYGG
jgi:hypothetical protein